MKGSWILVAVFLCLCAAGRAQRPDVAAILGYPQAIYYNGKIVTMDDTTFDSKVGTVVQAMAIRDGKILYTGTNADVQALAGPQTRKYDLKGRMVLPSFIITHEHLNDWAFQEPMAITHVLPNDEKVVHRWLPGKPAKEQIAMLEGVIKEAVSKARPGQWILVSGTWGTNFEYARDMTDIFDKSITKEWLDELAPNNPLRVRDGFLGSVHNAKAIEAWRAADPTAAEPKEGSNFSKTGRSFARPIDPMAMFHNDIPTLAKILNAEFENWAQYGLTGYGSGPYSLNNLRAYYYTEQKGESKGRFGWAYQGPNWDFATLAELATARAKGDYVFLIGAFASSGGNCMTVPGKPEFRELAKTQTSSHGSWDTGRANFGNDENDPDRGCNMAPGKVGRQRVIDTIAAGLGGKGMHTGGDKDIDYMMDAIEEGIKKGGLTEEEVRNQRNAFDHALARPAQISRMKRLNLMMSANNFLLWNEDGHPRMRHSNAIARYYGSEYAAWTAPRKSFTDAGLMSTFEIDRPIPHLLWRMIYIGMTRLNEEENKVYGPQERTDRIIQMKALTRWGSYYMHKEKELGTLEPGKWADFIVIDRDFLTIPDNDIPNVNVLMTMLAGKPTHLTADFAREMGMQPVGASTWKEPIPPGWYKRY
ncbi:MAG: amidohydrolase family protein [Acidobacteria bacterium]|nr:amidohydrolase family protein [Acidobacteriota bacterium]